MAVDHSRKSKDDATELNEKDLFVIGWDTRPHLFKGSKSPTVVVKVREFIGADVLEAEFKAVRAEVDKGLKGVTTSLVDFKSVMEKTVSGMPEEVSKVLLKKGDIVDQTAEKVSGEMKKFVDKVEKIIREQKARNDFQDKKLTEQDTVIAKQNLRLDTQENEIIALKKQMADLIKQMAKPENKKKEE